MRYETKVGNNKELLSSKSAYNEIKTLKDNGWDWFGSFLFSAAFILTTNWYGRY